MECPGVIHNVPVFHIYLFPQYCYCIISLHQNENLVCGGVVIMGAFKTATLRQLPAFFATGYLLCGLSDLCLGKGFPSIFGFSFHFFFLSSG